MQRILHIICTFLLCLAVAKAQDDGYYYRSWETEATVSADNTWRVDERYNVYFTEQSHGMYRYIQREFGSPRNVNEDGQPLDVRYKVYIPEVEVTYAEGAETWIKPKDENNCAFVSWGEFSKWVEGEQHYRLGYTYSYPDDRVAARDYLFHTIVPADVTTRIEHFTFRIRFEKELPADIADRLTIYTGKVLSEDTAKVENLVVTSHSISGTINDIEPYQAVTLYAELPEGFYEHTRKVPSWPAWVLLGLAFALACLMLYYEIRGDGSKITKSVEFYPPEGMTPLMVGTIIDEQTDSVDVAAMLPWLAERGYISIKELPAEKKDAAIDTNEPQNQIQITKLKDLPAGQDEYLTLLMHMLFAKSETVMLADLQKQNSGITAIMKAAQRKFEGKNALSTTHHTLLMWGLIGCSSLCIGLASPVSLPNFNTLILACIWLVSFLAAWGLNYTVMGTDLFRRTSTNVAWHVFRLVFFAGVCLMMHIFADETLYGDLCFSPELLLTGACLCFVVCELSMRNVHFSAYKIEMAGKLLGLREFIETAEKDRLQMLVEKDPEYFYKVLPYAMIFDMTDKWTKVFDKYQIEVPQTDYCTSFRSHTGSSSHFASLTRNMSEGIKTASYDHSTHSGGGSSGGRRGSGGRSRGRGYSGGGGGGGGAGRW